MKIRYLSHACFELKNEITLLIDPHFAGNELAPDYEGKPDLVLVTHEHHDHCDAERFGTTVVCPPAVTLPNAETMRIGEKRTVKRIPIEMIYASHYQSSYPTGFIFEFDGRRISHLGDTYLSGVKNIGQINILFIPIGGHFTMDVNEAVKALEIIRPDLAIPMHYNTFPQVKADPEEFKTLAKEKGFEVVVIGIDETIEI